MRKYIIKTLAPIFSVFVFLSVFSLSIFLVYGYRYDFQEKEVVSTSVIDLCIDPQKANVYLDGKLNTDNACSRFYGMALGPHSLEIKKPGFYSWKKDFSLDSDRAAVYRDILLIPHRERMTVRLLGVDSKTFFAAQIPDVNNMIVVDGLEIWKKNGEEKTFITRYSKPIQSAQYFYNTSHLLIATDSEVSVCDFEAQNCQLITLKDLDSPVFSASGSQEIVFVQNGILQEISLKTLKGELQLNSC